MGSTAIEASATSSNAASAGDSALAWPPCSHSDFSSDSSPSLSCLPTSGALEAGPSSRTGATSAPSAVVCMSV
eukprot:13546501-Heterocapsa_arctica.AAC.1